MSTARLLDGKHAEEFLTRFDIWQDQTPQSLVPPELMGNIWQQDGSAPSFVPLAAPKAGLRSILSPLSHPFKVRFPIVLHATAEASKSAKLNTSPQTIMPAHNKHMRHSSMPSCFEEPTRVDAAPLIRQGAHRRSQSSLLAMEERLRLGRTQSAPTFHHTRSISATQDQDFLGPSCKDLETTNIDEVKLQLVEALQALADLRLGFHSLKETLAQHDTTDIIRHDTASEQVRPKHLPHQALSNDPADSVVPESCTTNEITSDQQLAHSPSRLEFCADTIFARAALPQITDSPEMFHMHPVDMSEEGQSYDHLKFFVIQPGTTNIPPGLETFASASCTNIEYDRAFSVVDRRIQNRNDDVDWRSIVFTIVSENDQQASISLQQKLKIASREQKSVIIEAILSFAMDLMVNKFGNFLIQRCFEHGSQKHIHAIADVIRGNVLKLSQDAFGCHVVQKALDNISEEHKRAFVSELVQHIGDTITHKYACHVWQKFFEIRWNSAPPEIMSLVNDELYGTWADIAMGETGSLVVQNIFENCTATERLPCKQEVMANVPMIVRGQWGNWVIQHILQHGEAEDRSLVLDIIMQNAVEYSLDQYASKVIEKAIKSGDAQILHRYLMSITDVPALQNGRPRSPLVDIATDQYGNYLVQYILLHGSLEQRALIMAPIRKHMVSMRGSRYGSKVAFLVERLKHEEITDMRGKSDYRGSRSFRGHHYPGLTTSRFMATSNCA